ncbi:MAG: hypothetical protein OEY10_00455 [Nitrosopumilus sp.]|nr:hypothetical protein [Nitrosopumilus sp.]
MRDLTNEVKLILQYPTKLDGVYYPAGMFVSLPKEAFRMAFQEEPSFMAALHSKVEGPRKRGPKPKNKRMEDETI